MDDSRLVYRKSIQKVQDYMETHMMSQLTIEELAKVAGFSKFHFSRIFQSMLGESLAHYVGRIRMERAVFLLAHRLDKNMTDIAYQLGFTDSAVFSRAFKNYYGLSPKAYRQSYLETFKEPIVLSSYQNNKEQKNEQSIDRISGKITMCKLDAKKVVYLRHTGNNQSLAKAYPMLIQRLFEAVKKGEGLTDDNWLLAMYHDNPEFTDADQFRTSLGITVPDDFTVDEIGVLGEMTLAPGLYAVGHFITTPEAFPYVWDYMYQRWLTESGYMPSDAPPFEVYLNDPSKDKEGKIEVAIYLPIETIS